ncbi:hypothetical protein BJ546DRAFT_143805 [Cryomyces antarcticus]
MSVSLKMVYILVYDSFLSLLESISVERLYTMCPVSSLLSVQTHAHETSRYSCPRDNGLPQPLSSFSATTTASEVRSEAGIGGGKMLCRRIQQDYRKLSVGMYRLTGTLLPRPLRRRMVQLALDTLELDTFVQLVQPAYLWCEIFSPSCVLLTADICTAASDVVMGIVLAGRDVHLLFVV